MDFAITHGMDLPKRNFMEELTPIIASLEKDNPAAAATLTAFQTASNQALSRVSELEKDLKTSAEKRDQLKTIIRGATGLEEITADTLGEVLKGGDVDVYKNEITQLQTKLAEGATAVDEVSKGYEDKIFKLQLDRVVNTIGAQGEVHNPHAYNVVFGELFKNAVMDGDDIAYKNEDGTTIYAEGGTPATVMSQYEAIKADDNFAYLFKEQFKSGGGKAPSGPKTTNGGETIRRSTLKDEDKVKYIAQHGMGAYKNLAY